MEPTIDIRQPTQEELEQHNTSPFIDEREERLNRTAQEAITQIEETGTVFLSVRGSDQHESQLEADKVGRKIAELLQQKGIDYQRSSRTSEDDPHIVTVLVQKTQTS